MPQINYEPDPSGPVPHSRCANGFWTFSSGAPTCAGFRDQFNLDVDSGDIYQFQNGAWVQLSSGGGGSGPDVKFNSFNDPNGNVVGSVDDIYVSSIALGGDGSVWFKRTGNGTNTGWE